MVRAQSAKAKIRDEDLSGAIAMLRARVAQPSDWLIAYVCRHVVVATKTHDPIRGSWEPYWRSVVAHAIERGLEREAEAGAA
jgi:hypothetical protein